MLRVLFWLSQNRCGPFKRFRPLRYHKLVTHNKPIRWFVLIPPSASCILTRGGEKNNNPVLTCEFFIAQLSWEGAAATVPKHLMSPQQYHHPNSLMSFYSSWLDTCKNNIVWWCTTTYTAIFQFSPWGHALLNMVFPSDRFTVTVVQTTTLAGDSRCMVEGCGWGLGWREPIW